MYTISDAIEIKYKRKEINLLITQFTPGYHSIGFGGTNSKPFVGTNVKPECMQNFTGYLFNTVELNNFFRKNKFSQIHEKKIDLLSVQHQIVYICMVLMFEFHAFVYDFYEY